MPAPVLDLYDDHSGEVLRSLLPTPETIPGFIKEAGTVSADADDWDFALVMVDARGRKLRKYAHVDPGNTALSVMYFLERKDVLPEPMRKHAAHNLCVACVEHDMQTPWPLLKEAEGYEGDPDLHDSTVFEAVFVPEPVEVRQPDLDVMGIPLDTYGEVEKAAAWFSDNHRLIHPSQRRTVALGIDKRASALGVTVPGELSRYAGDGYARDLGNCMGARELLLRGSDKAGAYDLLLSKRAGLSPDEFVEALTHLDVSLGLDRHWDGYVPDPWRSTFDKTAGSEFHYTDGVDRVTGADLERMAREQLPLMKQHFADDLVGGFAKNPITVFKSLPAPVKTTIMRMARDGDHPPA